MKQTWTLLLLVAACGGKQAVAPAPDKGDAPPACAINVCETYGAAVPKVASDIVDKAAGDPEFSAAFAPLVAKGADAVAAFKTSLANFIAVAYGCAEASTYTGPDMPTAHAGMGITSQQYDDFIGLIAGVLEADGVPASDVTACFAPPLTADSFESTIVGQ